MNLSFERVVGVCECGRANGEAGTSGRTGGRNASAKWAHRSTREGADALARRNGGIIAAMMYHGCATVTLFHAYASACHEPVYKQNIPRRS
jgi:hypothetical protein